MIRIRATESCEAQPQLLWDTVWINHLDASGGFGDWMLAGPQDQPDSRGGLRAEAALHTATLQCLFTDRRLGEDEGDPPDESGDRRGWWGDSFRLEGEPEDADGSLLWTLERAVLNDETEQLAKAYAEEALATLAAQGAVARTEVVTERDDMKGSLFIGVAHYGHDGTRIYDQRFGVLWSQAQSNAPMNFGDGVLVI